MRRSIGALGVLFGSVALLLFVRGVRGGPWGLGCGSVFFALLHSPCLLPPSLNQTKQNPNIPPPTHRCSQIGNMRDDIKACKHIAEAAPSAANEDPQTAAWAARQLGVHYLKRYFLLIAYRSFLDTAGVGVGGAEEGGEGAGVGEASFVRWMEDRKELGHLLGHLSLET